MRKRKLAVAAAAALAVFSAGWVPEVLGAQLDQKVFVTDDVKGGCTVTAIPDISVHATTFIHFKMQSAGFEFDPTDGIKFVSKNGLPLPPKNEFVKQNSTATEFIVKDKNSKPGGKFAYEVHVRRSNAGAACTTLDPTVVNDGNCTEGCDPAPLPKGKK